MSVWSNVADIQLTPVSFRRKVTAGLNGVATFGAPISAGLTHFVYSRSRRRGKHDEHVDRSCTVYINPIGWPSIELGDMLVMPDGAEWRVTQIQPRWYKDGTIDHYQVTAAG